MNSFSCKLDAVIYLDLTLTYLVSPSFKIAGTVLFNFLSDRWSHLLHLSFFASEGAFLVHSAFWSGSAFTWFWGRWQLCQRNSCQVFVLLVIFTCFTYFVWFLLTRMSTFWNCSLLKFTHFRFLPVWIDTRRNKPVSIDLQNYKHGDNNSLELK